MKENLNLTIDKVMDKFNHGDKVDCPTCHAPGTIDKETPLSEDSPFADAIWLDGNCRWVCYECWLK